MQGMRKNFNIIFKLYTEIYENTSTNAMWRQNQIDMV